MGKAKPSALTSAFLGSIYKCRHVMLVFSCLIYFSLHSDIQFHPQASEVTGFHPLCGITVFHYEHVQNFYSKQIRRLWSTQYTTLHADYSQQIIFNCYHSTNSSTVQNQSSMKLSYSTCDFDSYIPVGVCSVITPKCFNPVFPSMCTPNLIFTPSPA